MSEFEAQALVHLDRVFRFAVRLTRNRTEAAYPRYTGGLIVQDRNGDGILDPKVDHVIGGVIGSAPPGARGQRALSPVGANGKPVLSGSLPRARDFGGGKGDGIMPVSFRTGNLPGEYRPTFELIGGTSAQFTVIALPLPR